MLVSVVIPVYRRPLAANAAIRSVLIETGVNVELIIVDDGSPEPFVMAPDNALDPRVRLVRNELNAGAAAARNRGVREARGRWIALLDSDDLWRPGKLAAQRTFAEAAQAAGAPPLTTFVTGFSQVNLATGGRRNRVPIDADKPEDFAAGCWFAPGSTSLIPRTAFERVGLFDERLERLEDLDWFLRLSLAGGRVLTLQSIWADVQVGSRPTRERLDRAISLLREKWLGSQGYHLSRRARRHLAAYLWIEVASNRYHQADWLEFLWAYVRSWILVPRLRPHLKDWWSVR